MTAYVKGAHPDDRMFGAPCGCVMLMRGFDTMAEGETGNAEHEWTCYDCAVDPMVKAAKQELRAIDPVAAGVYCHQNEEGLRWQ